MIPDKQTLYGWCKPQHRPAECLKSSWKALESSFKGGFCPSKKIFVGGDLGALPPKYLFLKDHEKCLDNYQEPAANYGEKCLPSIKPINCSIETWQKLRESFDGIGCPKISSEALPEGFVGKVFFKYNNCRITFVMMYLLF